VVQGRDEELGGNPTSRPMRPTRSRRTTSAARHLVDMATLMLWSSRVSTVAAPCLSFGSCRGRGVRHAHSRCCRRLPTLRCTSVLCSTGLAQRKRRGAMQVIWLQTVLRHSTQCRPTVLFCWGPRCLRSCTTRGRRRTTRRVRLRTTRGARPLPEVGHGLAPPRHNSAMPPRVRSDSPAFGLHHPSTEPLNGARPNRSRTRPRAKAATSNSRSTTGP
jgi:hypothetical protein